MKLMVSMNGKYKTVIGIHNCILIFTFKYSYIRIVCVTFKFEKENMFSMCVIFFNIKLQG